MDNFESEFGPAFDRFRNNLIGEALPLPPTYRFQHGEHADMKLVRTDGLQEDEVATVFLYPRNDSGNTQQLLLIHLADRLTFPLADRRKDLKDKSDDREQQQPGAKFVFKGQNMGDGNYMYDIRQQIGDRSLPLASFMCVTKERHEFEKVIKGALRDLALTLHHVTTQRSVLLPRPWPNPRWLKGMQP